MESAKITENDNKRTITTQPTEGCYDATLTEDNSNNCLIQKQLGLTRYIIPKPPDMMHNIPMYHTAKKLQHGQVLKFDTRKPDPGRRLWHRQEERERHETQECIIETKEQIPQRENRERNQKKGQNGNKKQHDMEGQTDKSRKL